MKGGRVWCIAVAALCALPAPAIAREIAVSPDGRHVYVAKWVTGFAGLQAWSRDPTTGNLSPGAAYQQRGDVLEMSPDGRSLYLAETVQVGSKADLYAFSRNPQTGALTPVAAEQPSGSPIYTDLKVSPDGQSLYAADSAGDRLLVYARNTSTGAISLSSTTAAAAGPLAITPDGGTVFAARDKLRVFDRLAGGALSPKPDVDCASTCQATSLVTTSDGSRLYAGIGWPKLFVKGSGGTWAEGPGADVSEGGFGTGTLPGQMAVTEDGSMYVVEEIPGPPGRGYLHQLQASASEVAHVYTYRDLKDGMSGLGQIATVAVSPDDRHVYARTGNGESPDREGVVVFERLADGKLRRIAIAGVRPPGYYEFVPFDGMEINGGDTYTTKRRVRVSLGSAPLSGAVVVSNDGGFGASASVRTDRAGNFAWTLASTGPDRLPKSVYVRDSSFGSSTFLDSIILDETLPVVSTAKRVRRRGRSYVAVAARDRVSGVRSVQLTTSRRRPGRWRRYSRKARYRVGNRRIYVRVRDRAGNRSKWLTVKRRRR